MSDSISVCPKPSNSCDETKSASIHQAPSRTEQQSSYRGAQSIPSLYNNTFGLSVTPSASAAVLGEARADHKLPMDENKMCRQQVELELLLAFESLQALEGSEDTENVTDVSVRTRLTEQTRSRCQIAKERYKTELWNQDFEPVLRRISREAEEPTKVEVLRRLASLEYTCCTLVQAEKDLLQSLTEKCRQISQISIDVMSLLRSSSGNDYEARCMSGREGSARGASTSTHDRQLSDKLAGLKKQLWEEALGEETRALPHIFQPTWAFDVQAHCDMIFTSLEKGHAQRKQDPTTTFQIPSAKIDLELITQLRSVTSDLIAVAQLREEHESLRSSMEHQRTVLDAKVPEVQAHIDHDLTHAAELLIEVAGVQAQVDQVRAATQADLEVTVKLRQEVMGGRQATR